MAILGLQGVRGGVGTTSLTAALAWALQILGENVLVIDASPDNLLRMSFTSTLSIRAVGRDRCWTARTGAMPGYVIPRSLIYCRLDSSPRKSGKIRRPGRRRWERSDRLSRR